MPDAIAAIFGRAPAPARARLFEMRDAIFRAAETAGVGPLVETLKWGEPAYLPRQPRVGTTLRLGWTEARADEVSLYVPCQTRLLDLYRDRFPDAFRYEGARAVHLPAEGAYGMDAFAEVVTLALTYHRAKRGRT